jgi:diacylglycerol O-acyltransferase
MRRLGGLDEVFVGLETHDHPLHMMAVLVLDPSTIEGGYTFERMREFVSSRLPAILPLRRRLVTTPWGLGRAGWVDVDVDIDAHVRRVRLDGGSLDDVAAYASAWDASVLDRSRPLWAMHFCEGLADGSVVVVAKVHHALMDGVGGMDFMASMFSLSPESVPVESVAGVGERAPSSVEMLARSVPEIALLPARAVRAIVRTVRGTLRERGVPRDGPIAHSERAPRVAWNGPLDGRRSVAMTSLPLDEVKALAHANAVTVNDVILSVLGGACRRYLAGRDELPDRSLLAAVPVNVRGDAAPDASNAVSLLFASIGSDVADPVRRLATVHRSARQARRQHDARGGDVLEAWLEVALPLMFSAVARVYTAFDVASVAPPFVNLLVSNVPGPPMTLYFGGARLVALYPLGPVYDGVGLNVTVVSSNDRVGFGLVSCPEVLADVGMLAAAVTGEYAALVAAQATARSQPSFASAIPA